AAFNELVWPCARRLLDHLAAHVDRVDVRTCGQTWIDVRVRTLTHVVARLSIVRIPEPIPGADIQSLREEVHLADFRRGPEQATAWILDAVFELLERPVHIDVEAELRRDLKRILGVCTFRLTGRYRHDLRGLQDA